MSSPSLLFKRSGGLKFSGRTPTAIGSGREDMSPDARRGAVARAWCLGLAALLLVLCALNATRRGSLGDEIPWPAARPLRIFDSSVSASASASVSARGANPNASTWARARLVGQSRGWGETFWALPTLTGEWAHRLAGPDAGPDLGARGAAWAIGALWILVLLWWCAALGLGLRRPSLGLGLLLLAQAFGAAYWLGARRAPIRRIQTASTCRAFDLGARTVSSGGMLTAQESIEWHRARGFAGLALADARGAPSRSGLLVLPSLGLQAHDGTQRLLLLPEAPVLLSLYSNERTIWQQARGAGALAIAPAPWRALGPPTSRELLSVRSIPPGAIEAWSGNVGDEGLARASRSRGLPVVGNAGVGSDCLVWTLLPSDVQNADDMIRALRQKRVAVAYALLESETPQNLETAQAPRPGVVARSWRQAMSRLSRAQRLNVWLQVLALCLALGCWGARPAQAVEAPSGPRTAMKFLRRKRLLRRANGLAAMALAFAGSAWAAQQLSAGWSALGVLLAWAALDALYLGGRSAWKRVH